MLKFPMSQFNELQVISGLLLLGSTFVSETRLRRTTDLE
jgi:hypothetical protein